jgi:MFS family permease
MARYRDDHEAMRPMTDTDDEKSTAGRSPASLLTRPLQPYTEIFRIPGAWSFSAAAVIGRMPMAMFGLGTVLLISAATGTYGMAGAVSALGSLGYAFTSPRMARLVDSYGQRRVLLPGLTVFVVATAALIAAVELRLATWTFFVAGTIAGAAMPSLGTMVRARWSVLLAGSPRLHAAFSFESVADELCFVIGPAAVTLLATEFFPASGIGLAALLCVAGSLWFAAQRGTEPVIVRPQALPATSGPRSSLAPRQLFPGSWRFFLAPRRVFLAPRRVFLAPRRVFLAPRRVFLAPRRVFLAPRRVRRGRPAPGLAVLAPVYLLLGAMFVSVDLSTVAFAQHFGHKPLAGFILGT